MDKRLRMGYKGGSNDNVCSDTDSIISIKRTFRTKRTIFIFHGFL